MKIRQAEIAFLIALNLNNSSMKSNLPQLLLLCCLVLHALAAFTLSSSNPSGTALNQQACNPQTTLDFRFSSSTTASDSTTFNNTYMVFLDRYGNDLNLSLSSFAFDTKSISLVSGYKLSTGASVSAGAIFKFVSGISTVYVYVPFTASSFSTTSTSGDWIDLTKSYTYLPSTSLAGFTTSQPLSLFNILISTDYNQWYTSVVGNTTILVSKFVYNINSVSTATPSSLGTTVLDAGFDGAIGTTGDKLCYASILTGNFQTHMRESVPLWFATVGIIVYWMVYIFSEPTNRSVFSKERHRDNPWTTWSVYSISHLAHQEFFTRLLRLTVILMQWSIQGVFIASIFAAQYTTGASIIIWSAAIAWAATLIFPFLWGSIFHSNIYEKHLAKLQLRKKIISTSDKEKSRPLQEEIDVIQQKIYGYNHWFYCLAFIIFFVCWPISVNRLQQLPRQYFYYQWYWLAAMGIVFFLEHFLMEPLMLLCFHRRELFKNRGGYYYDHRLGQLYQEVNDT